MPDKCQFCGEVAVIEESVDGGKDQLICIECGTLAGACVVKSTDFIDDDAFFEGEPDDESYTDIDESQPGPSLSKSSLLRECISCGVELDSNNSSEAHFSSSSKFQKLCSDCAELEDEEVEKEEPDRTHNEGSNFNNVSQTEVLDKTVESFQSVTTNESCSKCTSCGCCNLIIDSVNGDDRLVCTDCGQINSDAILTTDCYQVGENSSTSSARYYKTTLPNFAKRQRDQEGLLIGLSEISKICTKFCFPQNLKSEAEDMYRRLFHHPKILHITLRKKQCVAAVCLFVVCRQFDLPISATHFKDQVHSFSLFLKVKGFLVKKLKINLPHVSPVSQITEVVDSLKFDHKTTKKLKDILFLFRKAWLTQGRSRTGLISLAAYYAFISSSQCNKFISWKGFSDKYKTGSCSRQLAKECQYTLCKLADSLPWVKSKKVTPRTLPGYIDSILEYQESLFHLVFKPEEKLIETLTLSTQTPQFFSPLPASDNASAINSQCSKRPLVPNSQKERLLPFVFKKRKVEVKNEVSYFPVPSNVNLDSPILRENEFDDEISSYILSKEEQERMREHKMNLF